MRYDTYEDLRDKVARANAGKSERAAKRRTDRVKAALAILSEDQITPRLREIANLALRYPQATGTELGRAANPPLSEDGLRAAFNRLYALADQHTPAGAAR